MVDLTMFSQKTLAHRLCVRKGRLLPGTKEFYHKCTGADGRRSSVPQVKMHVPLPGGDKGDGVFVDFFRQLYPKHTLTSYRSHGSEAQLWKVRMVGPGAEAMHTDTTDAGGWYRTSVSKLCQDLLEPPSKTEMPLLIRTPNFHLASESEDCMERWLPNPATVQTLSC